MSNPVIEYTPRISEYALSSAPNFPSGNVWVRVDGQNCMRSTKEVFSGRFVVVFTVPGAFTPTCENQLKDFVKHEQEFYKLGVSKIICLAKDTIDVLIGWLRSIGSKSTIQMVSDPNAELPKVLRTPLIDSDNSPSRLGHLTYQRSAALLDEGKMRYQIVEDLAKTCKMSSALGMLKEVKRIIESQQLANTMYEEKELKSDDSKIGEDLLKDVTQIAEANEKVTVEVSK
jgi:peroxiredoxin